MEGAHGELRARLADRLRGDDAHRLAQIDRRAAGKITPIAFGADAVAGLASERRADADFLHARRLDSLDLLLLDQLAGLDDHLAGGWILHVLGRGATEHAGAERHRDLAGLDQRPRGDARGRTAVLLGDDAVLRHVDQTAGQIARVRRLQRGVGETLAGAVGRVEILEHRQPLLEVGDDRRLDDLARRLGHQAAHAGELLHLGRRAAGARMRHHIDGVDRLLPPGLRVALDRRDPLHHLLGDLLGALRPGIDDLVVLLASGDEAVIVLLLIFADELARLLHDGVLGLGDHHVVLAERDAGAARIGEAEPHDLVAEDDRLLLTAVAIDHVDHVGDVLLGEQPVDQVEADVRACAARGRRGACGRASSRRYATPACPSRRPCGSGL